MIKPILLSILVAVGATVSANAHCITSQAEFPGYKSALAQDARKAGVGAAGLQALASAQLSGITWRFESNPRTQTGTLQGDPAKFLAKRSGSSAQAFVNAVRSKVQRNASLFQSLERQYGVPGPVLATIWGLETSFGGYLGATPVVSGAVTLASYCRRHPKFEPHAIAALQLVDRGAITTGTKGGPSGELGHMQFLAGNWVTYGVDANGDGRADPYNAVDALATAARMLQANGWKKGRRFDDGSRNFKVLSAWNDSGNYQRAIAYAATAAAR